MRETWRPVVGYEGHYEVSTLGRVRSLKTRWGTRAAPLILTPCLVGKKDRQYWSVNLLLAGEKRNCKVHHLVLRAFVGPCPDACEGSHLDDDSLNNKLSNLVWETKSENCKRRRVPTGDLARNRKLSFSVAADVRRRVAAGETQSALAIELGVRQPTLSDVCLGKRWWKNRNAL